MKAFTIKINDLSQGVFDLSSLPSYTTTINIITAKSSLTEIINKAPVDCALEELNLSGCKNIKTLKLDTIPASLKRLYLASSGIETLEGILPEGSALKELDLHSCKNIKTLKPGTIPASLEKLNLASSGIETLEGILPEGSALKELDLNSCKNIKTLKPGTIPASLESLCLAYSGIETLEGSLPEDSALEELNLHGCENIKTLKPGTIPASLKRLYLASSGIETLEGILPEGSALEALDLNSCKNIKTLKLGTIPASLESLCLASSDIETLEGSLPKGSALEELNLSWCKNIKTLKPGTIPASLKRLYLAYSDIETLEGILPEDSALEELDLSGYKNIKTLKLGTIPASLKKLNLASSDIETLEGSLPEGCVLEELNLSACKNIKTLKLGTIPASLKKLNLASSDIKTLEGSLPEGCVLEELNLSACTKLQITQELVAILESLERSGCMVRYPGHFLASGTELAKERLRVAAANAKAQNPNLQTNSAEQLFHRFLTENIATRGGVSEIVAVTNPILSFLEENPLALKWVDKISSDYLEACINQPVNGLTEIAAFIEIAQKQKITEKLEAAKRVLAQDLLKESMAKLPREKKPGSLFEVEAGNALLREVHKKLLAEGKIQKAWLAVPTKISHEFAIQYWLTPEIINAAYEEILPKLQLDIFAIKDLLCETNHKENWAMTAFSDEFEKFKETLDKINFAKMNALQKLKEKTSLSEEELVELQEGLEYRQKDEFVSFYQEFARQQNPEIKEDRVKIIDEAIETISTSREKEVSKFIKDRTERDMPFLTGVAENTSFSQLTNSEKIQNAIIF
jgi:uncharacterized protein YjbI with pentapeptide repeats